MSRRRRWAAVAATIVVALLLMPCVARSSTTASIWVVEPGPRVAQWFGHTFLCFDDQGHDLSKADCYNFGTLASSTESFLSDFLAGRLVYRAEVMPAVRVAALYGNEHRAITRRLVQLSPEQVGRLRATADEVAASGSSYNYRPFQDNCTTRIAHVLRQALGVHWAAQADIQVKRDVASIRGEVEAELNRGPVRQAALVLLTDSLLGAIDSPGGVDGLFSPSQLTAARPKGNPVPTTLWRALFIVVMAGLGSLSAAGRGRFGLALVLGSLGLISWASRWFGGMPEMTSNVAWLLYCPLDLCLFWDAAWSRIYLLVRVGMVLGLAVASLAGIVTQPLAWPAAAVGAGLAICLWTRRGRRRTLPLAANAP